MGPDKTVYLHIGQDKAGSSAIQSFLHQNYARLSRAGYDLAGGRCLHHGKLLQSVVNGDLRQLRADCDYMRRSERTRFIISFEGIYALRAPKLRTLLAGMDDFRLVAVFYVRRRSDKLRSGFAQNLKLGRADQTKEARALIDGMIDKLRPENRPNMDYLAIVRNWQKCLEEAGAENQIRLRVYERSSFVDGDLLTDFCHAIDLLGEGQSPESVSLQRPKGSSNPSLSPTAQYLTIFSKVMRPTDEQFKRLQELIAVCDAEGANRLSLVPDRIAKALDRKYRSDDRILAREFLGRSRLFREPPAFRYARPDGESFMRIIREMAKEAKLFD